MPGPLVVGVDASRWDLYGNGVFDGCDRDATINHAVVLVGPEMLRVSLHGREAEEGLVQAMEATVWARTISSFETPGARPADSCVMPHVGWCIRSHSEAWGEDGYMRLLRLSSDARHTCCVRVHVRGAGPLLRFANEGFSFWRVLVRYLGGRLGKRSVVIKRAHLSSARKLAQGRTQALRKLSLGDVYFDPPHLLVLAKTSCAQARARLAQGRSARDPSWQPWNKDI